MCALLCRAALTRAAHLRAAAAQPVSMDDSPSFNHGAIAAKSSARMAKPAAGDWSQQINLADLPSYAAEKLAEFDTDGDGMLSVEEILRKGGEMELLRFKVRATCVRAVDGAGFTRCPLRLRRRGVTRSFSSSCSWPFLPSWRPRSASCLASCCTRARPSSSLVRLL